MVNTMKWMSPRVRIAMAMVSVVVCAMLVARFLGLMPDPEAVALQRTGADGRVAEHVRFRIGVTGPSGRRRDVVPGHRGS